MRDALVVVQQRIFRQELDSRLAEMETYRRRDFPRVGRLAQEAMVYAEQLGDFHSYIRSMLFSAWASVNLNEHETALLMGCEALVLARTHGFLELEAFALDVLGIGFGMIGAPEESLRLFDRMIVLADNLNDPELMFIARHDTAVTLLTSEHAERGLEMFDIAMQIVPQHMAESPESWLLYSNVCQMYNQFGQTDKALVYGEKALRQARAMGDDEPVAGACTALAHVCINRGDFSQAELYLHQARLLCSPEATYRTRFNIAYAEAQLYAFTGHLAEAIDAVERSYALTLQANLVAMALGQLQMLKAMYEDIGDKDMQMDVYRRMSEDIPKLQQQTSDIRLKILKMVFAVDKAAVKAELNLSQQKNAVMERLSREFRAPLDVIQSAADSISRPLDDQNEERRRDALRQITAQVGTMRIILDDIIELLQPDEYAQEPPKPVTLLELADMTLEDLKRYRVDGTRVVTHLPTKPVQILAAAKSLRTTFVHLLSNALKFSRLPVDFTLAVQDERLVVSVQDHGIGIPKAEQKAVLQPLYRASNNSETSGYGIGLALVAKEIAMAGGDIQIDSDTGEGTHITVRVPIYPVAA